MSRVKILPLLLLSSSMGCTSDELLPALGADAGPDRVGEPGDTFVFSAEDSYGEALSYRWTLQGPDLQELDLGAEAETPELSLVLHDPGRYLATVEVCDAWGRCVEDSAAGVASDTQLLANNAPIPNAGPDQTVAPGDLVILDGTLTFDLEGEIFGWNWAFSVLPAGSTLVNNDITDRYTSIASFTPDAQGVYTARLKVDDGTTTAIDKVNITALSATNTAPTVDAGADVTAVLGAAVSLTGTGSDLDGDTLSYRWSLRTLPTGSTLKNTDLTDRYTNTVTFTPDVRGTFELKLNANDGAADGYDYVKVAASSGVNNAPTANAGADLSAYLGDTVLLDGSGSSDADGDSLSYRWTFSILPAGSALTTTSISNRTTTLPSFTPDVAGVYELKLVADDGLAVGRDTVSVTVYTYDFHVDVRPILTARCATCHTGGTPPGGLNLNGSPYTSTVNVPSSQLPSMDLVEPGDSNNSYLYLKINNTHLAAGGSGARMPKSGAVLTTSQLLVFQTWIDEGAPN